jgi:membrane fusion protein (multidrug efflux system)
MHRNLLFCFLALISAHGMTAEDPSTPKTSLTALGTLYPQYKTTVGSIVSGRVREVLVDVGSVVKKDQPLLTLDTTFFEITKSQAESSLAAATVERVDAERNFERMKRLWEKPDGQTPSISKKRYEDALTRFEQASLSESQAMENLKRARANLEEATIKAPYDGVITKRLVDAGEPVTSTPVTKLLEILSIDSLYIEFSVPEIYQSRLHTDLPIYLRIEGTDAVVPAKIHVVFPDIDEKTRSVKCRALVSNVDRTLHPGALVHIDLALS